MNRSTKSRLTIKQLSWFPGNTLFEKIARCVCRAGTLPGKELFEAWEVARRVRRKFRGGRVVDLACGHGLLAHIMLLLDDTSPEAIAIDRHLPENAYRLSAELMTYWPRLRQRIAYVEADIETVAFASTDVIMSVHACGALTDTVLEKAVEAGARVAVLPCCHDLERCDTGGLEGWLDGPTAVDVTRAARLRAWGYQVMTRRIPEAITPKNRLLMGRPEYG
ncbi:methyltransferase [uncultured Desulfosarcina sp.]|uniref:methyltransferase n=1 Tax=uncultured Desulfosarcina sp. TaxID=218289 RepID=UPI0029C7326E|nr:methyltransferase [uncultured Desulfosarcina sp.]